MNATSAVEAPRTLDWNVAVGTAVRLMKPGPEVPKAEAARAVRSLRRFSAEAESHVRERTGLGLDLPIAEGDVVDRPDWVRGAAFGLSEMTSAALATVDSQALRGGDLLGEVSARSAGVQAGVVLAYLGGKVLGQFDPYGESGVEGQRGRLLLVAPNIVAAQQSLGVPADDFLMWVCLHESTHRLQFNAVPWLREHFAAGLGELLTQMEGGTGELLTRLPNVIREARTARRADSSPGVVGLLELLQSPEQRAALDRIIAISTLLEGHADHVMDAVGPQVVPSVGTIRRRFTERRAGGGVLDRILRSLLGVDAKIRQYAQGAAFTDHVVDRVGMSGFNAVWAHPDNLPTRSEITDPDAWIRRVHG
ncbi:zinc-dependent metalloprotease [Saccharopolyspora sp. TS4A08]|uniref:Zinc-dependent metalloprotease n=1 Tax=Saccharopolyspora ipomoeae TaxID=3042027 RepID=A0ABT6PRY3_9PSEU|nr:zinc-dependent metalloprotease [Saccharopolyspora sp. TS4A08]MDI2030762.1 zinc-dependent metalloprotease [Saccharopolyspora sp. TS4A08]